MTYCYSHLGCKLKLDVNPEKSCPSHLPINRQYISVNPYLLCQQFYMEQTNLMSPCHLQSSFQSPGQPVHIADHLNIVISRCPEFTGMTKEQKTHWIKENKRCWRCARSHQAAKCDLKKCCATCKGRHLQILCDVNQRSNTLVRYAVRALYLDLMKVVKVILHNGKQTLDKYAVLDHGYGSQRTILLLLSIST